MNSIYVVVPCSINTTQRPATPRNARTELSHSLSASLLLFLFPLVECTVRLPVYCMLKIYILIIRKDSMKKGKFVDKMQACKQKYNKMRGAAYLPIHAFAFACAYLSLGQIVLEEFLLLPSS